MLQKYKADTSSRLQEQKRIDERKRNILVIIHRHLIQCGYTEAASNMTRECNIDLEKWEVADNIDLFYVIQDFEEYFEMKFMKKPVLVRKIAETTDKKQKQSSQQVSGLPPQSQKQQQARNSTSTNADSTRPSATSSGSKAQGVSPLFRQNSVGGQQPSKYKQIGERQDINQGQEFNDFEIQGKKVEREEKKLTEEQKIEEFFENRILKPLPDYSFNPELKELAMSIQNEIINTNPGVNFQNIIGLEQAKKLLKEAVLMPLKYPHFFQGILEPWKGILLFGPPGTGKTMLAKAVATECRTTFFNISASTIVSKWRGDSEKLVRVLFELARYHQPSTIFVDEIDSIMSSRTGSGEHEASRRMKTELLIQLDGLIKSKGERVFLLAASNLPWDLDMGLLRRLEKRILVPLPEEQAREAMVRHHLPPGDFHPQGVQAGGGRACQDIDFYAVAQQLDGYSGSDVRLVCKEAAMKPLRRLMKEIDLLESQIPANQNIYKKDLQQPSNYHKFVDQKQLPSLGQVTSEDIQEAIKNTKAAAKVVNIEKYQKWMENYGSI